MSKTLGKQLRDHVRGGTPDDSTVEVVGDHAGVSVDVEHAERYAVGVRGIQVKPTQRIPDVGDTAERIARDVDVIDRLRVVEYDAAEEHAILRSAEPQRDDEGVNYWEAAVTPDETSLHRYHKPHTEPDRVVVVEPLSYGELGELTDQIVDAVTGPSQAQTPST